MSEPTQSRMFENFDYDWHKIIYLDETSKPQERNASGQWLLDNGYIGLHGKQIITDRK